MTKYPFIKTVDGLEFRFALRSCRKTVYGHRSPSCGRPVFTGMSHTDRIRSQHVTICRHVDEFDWEEWAVGDEMLRHVKGILESQRLDQQEKFIKAHLSLSPGDSVYESTWGPSKGKFVVEISNLTIDQAFQIYWMADAIRGESNDS